MTKRIFEIEWDDGLGSMWMNEDNLMSCLCENTHVGHDLNIKVKDVTDVIRGDAFRLNLELNHHKRMRKLIERDKAAERDSLEEIK